METNPATGKLHQTDQIRDHVFPLCVFDHQTGKVVRMLGSAFLIGERHYALTAAHCIRGETTGLAAMFIRDREWYAYDIVASAIHPSEDVGLVRLQGSGLTSMMRLSKSHYPQAHPYKNFGYPEDVYYEMVKDGAALIRPDLVYTEGYIRRRITDVPMPFPGRYFFELSAISDPGSSGSPVMKINPGSKMDVFGIYVGERRREQGAAVGYAVRVDGFGDWQPEILDRTVYEESQ